MVRPPALAAPDLLPVVEALRQQASEARGQAASALATAAQARQEARALRQELTAAQARENAALAAASANPVFDSRFIPLGGDEGEFIPSADPDVAPNTLVPWYSGGPKRRWGHEQATGAPDTATAGDIPTAWAAKTQDGGPEWLRVDIDQAIPLARIRVVESHNPGAISRIAALRPDGREETIWEGVMDATPENQVRSVEFPVPPGLVAGSVVVHLDTTRVAGWNEIDAVQFVGANGEALWGTGSTASSSYSDPAAPEVEPSDPTLRTER